MHDHGNGALLGSSRVDVVPRRDDAAFDRRRKRRRVSFSRKRVLLFERLGEARDVASGGFRAPRGRRRRRQDSASSCRVFVSFGFLFFFFSFFFSCRVRLDHFAKGKAFAFGSARVRVGSKIFFLRLGVFVAELDAPPSSLRRLRRRPRAGQLARLRLRHATRALVHRAALLGQVFQLAHHVRVLVVRERPRVASRLRVPQSVLERRRGARLRFRLFSLPRGAVVETTTALVHRPRGYPRGYVVADLVVERYRVVEGSAASPRPDAQRLVPRRRLLVAQVRLAKRVHREDLRRAPARGVLQDALEHALDLGVVRLALERAALQRVPALGEVPHHPRGVARRRRALGRCHRRRWRPPHRIVPLPTRQGDTTTATRQSWPRGGGVLGVPRVREHARGSTARSHAARRGRALGRASESGARRLETAPRERPSPPRKKCLAEVFVRYQPVTTFAGSDSPRAQSVRRPAPTDTRARPSRRDHAYALTRLTHALSRLLRALALAPGALENKIRPADCARDLATATRQI